MVKLGRQILIDIMLNVMFGLSKIFQISVDIHQWDSLLVICANIPLGVSLDGILSYLISAPL